MLVGLRERMSSKACFWCDVTLLMLGARKFLLLCTPIPWDDSIQLSGPHLHICRYIFAGHGTRTLARRRSAPENAPT